MKALGRLTLTFLALVYGTILNGWGLTKLWAWFVVATFDVKPLRIPEAIGLALIVAYTTKSGRDPKTEESDGQFILKVSGELTCKVLLALALGAIVKRWI